MSMISIVLFEFSMLACLKILLRLLWFCQILVANLCNDRIVPHAALFHRLLDFRVEPEQSK